ncbi:unnamed protein product, partial [Symbiodinium pilosum]
MRVDAAEFVPFAAASNDDAWTGSSHPSMYGGGVGAASGLSADSPAFVPGAQDVTAWQTVPPWEVWQAGRDHSAPVAEYGAAMPECTETAPIVTYVDEETFLTPQLLEEMPELAAHSMHSLPLSPSGKEAPDDGNLPESPEKELLFSHSHASFSGSSQAATTEEPSRHSELTGTGCATSSTCPSATTGSCAGVLSVHGRKLHWTLTGRDCQSCNDLFLLDEWPQGEGVESPRFVVAGVPLRMIFFPAGAALTGEGDCAVGVLCEDG